MTWSTWARPGIRLTGLPFVFALWVARAGVDLGDLPDALEQSRAAGPGAGGRRWPGCTGRGWDSISRRVTIT